MNNQIMTTYIGRLMDEFVQGGVQEAVVCPGSRSTPLAMLALAHQDINVHVLVDERSAAFYALGLAKASQKSVLLICTSGTAAANFYPAIVEAHYSRVPLIVLTADRPHELREVGAPQAIDQQFLFGKFVKWFTDLALPEDSQTMLRYVQTAAARANHMSMQEPKGPVQINVPLREPLLPDLSIDPFEREETDRKKVLATGQAFPNCDAISEIVTGMNRSKKGLIVCGELHTQKEKEAVLRLSKALHMPILADPLSHLRNGHEQADLIIDAYDSLLKDEALQQHLLPDMVIRFGPMPVSKPLFKWLEKHVDVNQIVVDAAGGFRDPGLSASYVIESDVAAFVDEVVNRADQREDTSFLKRWQDANSSFRTHAAHYSDEDLSFEGNVYRQLQHLLPKESVLFIGNSMPIRDVDTFFEAQLKPFRMMANRGANGIDGVVSTALGTYAALKQPVTLVIGDLSFYHDMNGLLAAKLMDIPLTVVLLNNDGGGIFSFLPQASEEPYYEKLFGTPTGLNFEYASKLYGGTYAKPSTKQEFHDVYKAHIEEPGLHLIEIETDRHSRASKHRQMMDDILKEVKKECLLS
ncbi:MULTISPECIES: 2-succinyl-5-enolpyruvyl-6-hydroxy-3-cyclohexene-1-carboxylic-acid synthase [Bacillus]|uniref:2-succinyl-5-enolpyruvyl-6-hydroxy-3- cyclohexene-1-carboxylic-acid synthase n=1 Tax=Bacillus TaxID=1386 RepID=UPI0007179597|nr:2-succinyl-5-enolpyruvyl-6-hydroxy-3-cyclohexene-1-carboxylic-acid synthase [Bacillus pumilus]KRU15730.1 2-succinyl-5-enolpyruvyl-6-hydroxy-3-cyclohexene-1-carboxylate synthase [Bacillus pumilus]MCY7678059.1 2-succinyl-5-enolpyruvyl-6-hydroxy-3-cyclohexene-1-carboxylic-acid synthase [Bacillus pumilus]